MTPSEREELIKALETVDVGIAKLYDRLRVAHEERGAIVARLGAAPVEEPQEPALAALGNAQAPREYRHRLVHPAHFGLEFVPHLVERFHITEAHLLRRLPEGTDTPPDLLSSLCGHEYPWRRWEEVDARGNAQGLVQMCSSCADLLDQHREVEHRRS